ncbi:CBS domain-containing protein [Enterococcus gilvus]|uniref:CBS domain-containing protein n=1 Tax=Enterococcus gilvus ATCC BAA-350 TaxID=1158614 RepID=R2XPN5_9ENTE|nr:CBS domain-containing protein [Enterococcus gilvus]EOI56493.1 hypothetical protein UKC_02408 [Enterococcus gilvus ATCC BAA-350]EOW82257.1 hypothetical protein I592_01560 [Enterococcus gilvus ATCC BAA-350]OJG42253.1 hypothetical protein RV02_GL003737 [Enterococcus gilvus]
MGERAEIFLSTFNRIEKELKRQLGNPANMGFSEAVRRLSKRHDNLIGDSENDLLQLAQLRNAIVHDQVADDFVIAEPNEWAVTRIKQIEENLLRPEKVLPRFEKNVTGFERNLPLKEIMKIITEKRFSQFPVYDKGEFMGLITLRTIGFYFAQASLNGSLTLEGRVAEDLLLGNGKRSNFKFVSGDTKVSEVEKMFHTEGLLEAILITKNGNSDGNLLGIIRPRDIYIQEGEQ